MSQTLITKNIPSNIEIPDNKYEAVLYLNNLKAQLSVLQNELESLTNTITDEIADTEDDTYICEPVFDKRKTSTLDYAMFEEDLPEQYKDSLSIRASDAEKLLGKDRLKQMVIDTVGWENFESTADVTLTEARKHIPKNLQAKYITEHYKKVGYEVRRK